MKKRFLFGFLLLGCCLLLISGAEDALSLPSASPAGPASLKWYVTKSGYIAATEEVLLEHAVGLALGGDASAFRKFVDSTPDVFPLRGGLKVQLVTLTAHGKVRIRPEGTTLSVWTLREALK